ncbi:MULTISPECIES: autotransporter outer membrane beta-barrel domain-containing protein [Bradyrhizobium]|uniref:autotransporter outer membrane beta-barrel domain-containing protein n=1 Tax=Bradyrhizobium elkanii TaxID=29448 RepID=UPI00041AC468|nr:autotransporter domain-containing protein [Bradyrhizobium elkanii]
MWFRLPAGLGAHTAAVAAILAGLCLSTVAANAQCVPDPATSGASVTCSGLVPGGFVAGAGVNNLTVNVQSGATVGDNGTAAIGLNDSNTVINNGTLNADAFLTGLNVGNSNTVTNNDIISVGESAIGIGALNNNSIANNGTISAGSDGFAISVGDGNVVTNSGALSAGNRGTGILGGQNNTIANTAAGSITVGNSGNGIFVAGNSTVTNAGTITTGFTSSPAAGIFAINDNNTITNTAGASIIAGQGAAGISVQGNNAVISNAGSITSDDFGMAIIAAGDNTKITNSGTINVGMLGYGIISFPLSLSGSGTITNTGSIVGGDSTTGVFAVGDSLTVTNAGTITVGNGAPAAGINVSTAGPAGANQVINTGTINVGSDAVGIVVNGGGSVFNSGTINAAAGFAAIEFCGCAPGSASVLTLGPGSVIHGLVLANGSDTFQLGGTGTGTFDLSLIGPGNQYDGFLTFNKVDSSKWTVTGTGAQDWNVLGGTLAVDGVINGSVAVSAGGVLSGIGTVGNTAIASGGAFMPGNAVPGASTTVAGNLALQSGALYLVQLSSTASSFAHVTGTATLGGSVAASLSPGSSISKRPYTILTADGGLGGTTFSGLNVSGLPGALTAALSYDATNAYLTFGLDFGAKSNLNVNQQNVAGALTNFFNANGSIPLPFASLTPAGLTQASGEVATGSQQATFNAMNLFLGLLTDPFIAGRDGGLSDGAGATPFADVDGANAYASTRTARSKRERDAYAAVYRKVPAAPPGFDPRWSVWAAGFGGSQTTDGNAVLGSNNASSNIYGTAVGFDYRVSPSLLAGFALAGGGTNFSVNGFGWGRSDLFQAGAFARTTTGPAYLSAAFAYGWQDVTTDRFVTIAGVDHLRAEFNANTYSGRLEGGYRYATPWLGLTPYAAAQVTTFELPNYAEAVVSGANTFALNYTVKSVTDTRTELGLRADKSFAVEDGIVTLRGRAAWAHDFNPDRAASAVFQTLPGAAFVVNGAAQAPDSALTTASLEMKWLNGWSAAGTFEGEFSGISQSYAGKGVVRFSW